MALNKTKIKKIIKIASATTGAAFCGLTAVAKMKKNKSVYGNESEQKNPLEGHKVVFVQNDDEPENADGARGHLESIGMSDYKPGIYDKYIKRTIDVVLSFGGLVILSPVYLGISLAIIVDDPGPVLFTQKRMGQNKKYFKLHKFRSMKMCTPHDVPTHMLENPEQYITRLGKFLRAHSLDELPQIWDIFIGNMSVIGPRPGLWNQDVLTAERDKYGANDVKPGLTGWAQINGRDELEIPVKAKLDGEYVDKLGLLMDIKCFLGSLRVFAHDDSVVEGGTGEMRKTNEEDYTVKYVSDEKKIEEEKKILITGANSYIGVSVEKWLSDSNGKYKIDTLDMIGDTWKDTDFSKYDVIYHVAGIAHADVGNVTEEQKQLYYKVNTQLTLDVAKKAKEAGVKQFIFMSSMIVYSGCNKAVITKETQPKPLNFYGDSKWQADRELQKMNSEDFKVVVLRPPMIYGKGSKGNYPELAKLAARLPLFPRVKNKRSMLHIDNLCQFVKLMIDNEEQGVFFPQNAEYTNTSDMVYMIASVKGHRIIMIPGVGWLIKLVKKVPGKIGGLATKAFGDSAYEMDMSEYKEDYRVNSLKESIYLTEGKE